MEATINKELTKVKKAQLMDFDVYKPYFDGGLCFIYISLATGERMRNPMKAIHGKEWPKHPPVVGACSYYYASCSEVGWAPYQGDHDTLHTEYVWLVPPTLHSKDVKEALKALRDLDVPVKLQSGPLEKTPSRRDEEQKKFLASLALIRKLKELHGRREISDQVLIRRLKAVEATGPIMGEYIKNLIKFHEKLHENKRKPSSPIQSYTWFDWQKNGLDYETEVARLRAEHLEAEIEKAASENPCGEIKFGPDARTRVGSPKDVDLHTDEDLTARGKRKTAESTLMFDICAFDKQKAKTVVATLRQLGFESDESAKLCLLAIDNKIKQLNALRDVVKEMQ